MQAITAEQIQQKLAWSLLPGEVIEAPVLVEDRPTCAVVRHLRGTQQTLYLAWLTSQGEEVLVKRIYNVPAGEYLAVEQATAAPSGVKLQLSWWRHGKCVQRAWLFEDTTLLPRSLR